MEFEPEFSPEKEAILARSPLVAAIFDRSLTSDSGMWAKMVSVELKKSVNEIEEKFGERNFQVLALWPLTNFGNLMDVFSENADVKEKEVTVMMLLAAGYQIGSVQESGKFIDDMIFQMVVAKSLKSPKTEKDFEIMTYFVWGVISSGAAWKISPEDKFPDVPDSIKEFIRNQKGLEDL